MREFVPKPKQVLLLIILLLGTVAIGVRSQAATAVPQAPASGLYEIYLPVAGKNFTPGDVGSGEKQIYAYSDAAVLQPNSALLPLLTAQKPLLCQAKAAPQTWTLNQALQNGWNYLSQQIGAANAAGFRAAPEVDSAGKAQMFAMSALADNRPDGALAGLLQAYTLNPQSPITLVNAAGIFATLNMPNEGLALLDAAEALPGPMETPMGIPGEELAANNRGYALLLLGQWAAAENVLRPLAESNTELSEARRNMSLALLCQDKDDEAMYFYRLGARRMMWDKAEYGEEIEGIRPPIDLTLERSAGELFTLPPLGVMHTPGQAQTVWEHTNELINDNIARDQELNELIEANTDLRNNRPLPGPITLARFSNIYITAMRAGNEPDILALYEAAAAQETVITTLQDEQTAEYEALFEEYPEWDAFTAACRSTVTGHLSVWLTEYFQFEDMLAAYTEAKYAAMTGTAANLGDDLNHEFVSLNIEHEMQTDLAWRVHMLNNYAATTAIRWAYCEGIQETAQTESADPVFTWAAKCPAQLTRNKLGVNLIPEILQVRANCEVFEIEINGPTWITVFGQVSIDMKNKTATIFAGGKLQSPPGTLQMALNDGFYITLSENGVSDLGMKASSSVDVGVGPFVGVIDGDSVELGVAGAVEYWNTPPSP
ncbi:MAG: hypothetical protein CL608_14065 [Anaerolineaceae bacterium]|nr:hypothetical protein [Anaerolineaceae bacterium]